MVLTAAGGTTTYVRSRPTDLLVWSMRMTHSGAGTLLTDPSRPDPEPEEWNAFSDEEVAPLHENRLAVFAHIGANDKHARRYLDYLRHRTYIANMWRNHPFTPETIAELESGWPDGAGHARGGHGRPTSRWLEGMAALLVPGQGRSGTPDRVPREDRRTIRAGSGLGQTSSIPGPRAAVLARREAPPARRHEGCGERLARRCAQGQPSGLIVTSVMCRR